MAQRRMFSPDIVCSDAFLDMPASACHLYFQLGMYADDDGFVNPRKIMRMLGSSEDDLKILIAKRFVLPFQSGVVVVKHWKINNLVRKDWYRPSQYLEEKSTLYLKESGAYTDDSSQGIPVVNEPLTIRQHRSGQVRIESGNAIALQGIRIEKDSDPDKEVVVKTKPKYPHAKEVFSWFPDRQKSWELNTTELKHAELLFERGEEKVRGALSFTAKHKDDEMFYKITKPSDLERKWVDLVAYADKV